MTFQGHFFVPEKADTMQKIKNTNIFAVTIVAPTGVPHRSDTKNPVPAQNTAVIAEQTITLLKLWNILIAVIDGNIISAEINNEPTRLIASTIIIAVITAIIRLYASVFIPVAFEKFSSNVTANILL